MDPKRKLYNHVIYLAIIPISALAVLVLGAFVVRLGFKKDYIDATPFIYDAIYVASRDNKEYYKIIQFRFFVRYDELSDVAEAILAAKRTNDEDYRVSIVALLTERSLDDRSRGDFPQGEFSRFLNDQYDQLPARDSDLRKIVECSIIMRNKKGLMDAPRGLDTKHYPSLDWFPLPQNVYGDR